MRRWTASLGLIAIIASQLFGAACGFVHHSPADVASDVTSHHESHAGYSPSHTETPEDDKRRAPGECVMMMGCSAITAHSTQLVRHSEPSIPKTFAGIPKSTYRNPPLVTPTPPPRFG